MIASNNTVVEHDHGLVRTTSRWRNYTNPQHPVDTRCLVNFKLTCLRLQVCLQLPQSYHFRG